LSTEGVGGPGGYHLPLLMQIKFQSPMNLSYHKILKTFRSILCLIGLAVSANATTIVGDLTIPSLTFEPWNGSSTRETFIGSTYPGFTGDLFNETSAQITLRAPAGFQFSVHAPAGDGVGFAAAFYYSTPGWSASPQDSFLNGVTVAFEGLTGAAPPFVVGHSGRIGQSGSFARFNATVFDPIESTFSFTAMTLTWTWPQIQSDPGVTSYDPLGGGSFSFYSDKQISDPFITLEAAEVTAPEPGTFLAGAFCALVCLGSTYARRRGDRQVRL
jgi:hypothetical protein